MSTLKQFNFPVSVRAIIKAISDEATSMIEHRRTETG
jgi:hypothetical protein